MPNIYGQLVRAQLEVLASNPSALIGRIHFNSTDGKAYLSDATNVYALLRNDDKAILGNSGTASENIRLHRGAAGVLQLVEGDDATNEGTLSTSLAQGDARLPNFPTGSLPAAGQAGRLLFDTTTTHAILDNGTVLKTLVDLDSSQTISGKTITTGLIQTTDIDGGTATDTSRVTLPKETTANLNGLTDKEATVAFDTTLQVPVFNDGVNWAPIGTAPLGRATVADADKTALTTEKAIAYTSITVTRTATLFAANAVAAGTKILVGDESGSVSLSILLKVAPNGADTINGVNAALDIYEPFGFRELTSDGVSKWTVTNKSSGITAWESFVPVFSWVTGVNDVEAFLRRTGDTLEMQVSHGLNAAPTATTWKMDLPLSLTADIAKIPNPANAQFQNLGHANLLDSNTVSNRRSATVMLDAADATKLFLFADNSATVTELIPFTWTNTDNIRLRAYVPIDGWTTY